MIVSGNTSLRQYLRIITISADLPKCDIRPVFRFWFWKWWRFPVSLMDVDFETFQIAQKYSISQLNAANMLTELLTGNKSGFIHRLYFRIILRMPIKKVLPIILHYQKEFNNIAELIEKQNELLTVSEQSRYNYDEFGYSTISYMLAEGNRQQAREFIDKQPVSYVIAEYRRQIKNIENQRYEAKKTIDKIKK